MASSLSHQALSALRVDAPLANSFRSGLYVGFDVSKAKHAVGIAESGRTGEVRYFGEIEATPAAVEKLVRRPEKNTGGCIFSMKPARPATACIARL
jgi:hypothetical protein